MPCRKLLKQKNSVLFSTSSKDVKVFKWTRLIKPGPTLYKFLKSFANNEFNSKPALKLKPFIRTAGAILLKGRNERMSAVQYLVGLCLHFLN